MMKGIYSCFDSKAAIYSAPFFSPNDMTAVRDFARVVADPNTTIHHAPEDFTLHNIGAFDDTTGEIVPSKAKAVITASAVLAKIAGMPAAPAQNGMAVR